MQIVQASIDIFKPSITQWHLLGLQLVQYVPTICNKKENGHEQCYDQHQLIQWLVLETMKGMQRGNEEGLAKIDGCREETFDGLSVGSAETDGLAEAEGKGVGTSGKGVGTSDGISVG